MPMVLLALKPGFGIQVWKSVVGVPLSSASMSTATLAVSPLGMTV